jgi:hypothetical protein
MSLVPPREEERDEEADGDEPAGEGVTGSLWRREWKEEP